MRSTIFPEILHLRLASLRCAKHLDDRSDLVIREAEVGHHRLRVVLARVLDLCPNPAFVSTLEDALEVGGDDAALASDLVAPPASVLVEHLRSGEGRRSDPGLLQDQRGRVVARPQERLDVPGAPR